MKSTKSLALLGFLVFAALGAPIESSAEQSVKLRIRGDGSTRVTRLVIPRKFLKDAKLVASADDPLAGANLRTIIAGIALSIAAICMVFVFLRHKGRGAKTTAGLFLASAAILFCSEIAIADVPPALATPPGDEERVVIEIAELGDMVELILGDYERAQAMGERYGQQYDERLTPPGKEKQLTIETPDDGEFVDLILGDFERRQRIRERNSKHSG